MTAILLIFLLLGAAMLAASLAAGPRPARQIAPAEPPDEPPLDQLSPTELAATDPLAALIRYGTPDDAARLGEQGVDLGQLGYRPPTDEQVARAAGTPLRRADESRRPSHRPVLGQL